MKKILRILEKDARLSAKEISSITNQSEEAIKNKIEEMEKKQVIRKYKTVINWELAGKKEVYAMIDVNVVPERDRGYDAVAERIMRFPEVRTLYLISGKYDLSVLVRGKDYKEVAFFVSDKLAPLDQVTGTNTHFMLKRYKEDGDVLFGEEANKRLAISP
jgi:DNA-binding Lrp family transcriptional regulator|tara:strand:+ start:1295 stop:1774 length:480 start_codon:yes stop_codon:yes gene_type:complete